MSQVNTGGQILGWKFSTALKADELNTFFMDCSGPGLLTRPCFQYSKPTSAGIEITIYPFAMLVAPSDKYNQFYVNGSVSNEEGDKKPTLKLVKITTTALLTLTVSNSDVAIGFSYSFANSGVLTSQWYGEFVTLDAQKLEEFKNNHSGIIIATVQNRVNATGSRFFSITTNGADISDALLRQEGWNPRCWLSVVHPYRAVSNKYNRLEVRCHNDLYDGYINGNSGCVELSNLTYILDNTLYPDENENGTRGFMPNNYNLFSLQSRGFYLSDGANSMPVTKTHGGVFALVNAYDTNLGPIGMGGDQTSFTNRLKISPVAQEDINIYYDNNTLVIN